MVAIEINFRFFQKKKSWGEMQRKAFDIILYFVFGWLLTLLSQHKAKQAVLK